MPERRADHVLNCALFSVSQLDLCSLLANAWTLPAHCTRRNRLSFAHTRLAAALLARLWREWLAVPLRIVEVKIRLHEIKNGEIVLSVVKPRSPPDDLLEFNHRVDRAHENNVTDVAGVHPGRKFLRGGQNRGNRLFVVLKIPKILVT